MQVGMKVEVFTEGVNGHDDAGHSLGLVQEEALAQALSSGHLTAAYLDVLSSEPPSPQNPLPPLQNAIITPHIAWATRAARRRLVQTLTENVVAWLNGHPQNVVNSI